MAFGIVDYSCDQMKMLFKIWDNNGMFEQDLNFSFLVFPTVTIFSFTKVYL